jgi:hypothetical protein
VRPSAARKGAWPIWELCIASNELSFAGSPPIRMVEGAEPWCDANPDPALLIGAEAGVAGAAGLLLWDRVPTLGADSVAVLAGRGFGSNGGASILVPGKGARLLRIWGVIDCRL